MEHFWQTLVPTSEAACSRWNLTSHKVSLKSEWILMVGKQPEKSLEQMHPVSAILKMMEEWFRFCQKVADGLPSEVSCSSRWEQLSLGWVDSKRETVLLSGSIFLGVRGLAENMLCVSL